MKTLNIAFGTLLSFSPSLFAKEIDLEFDQKPYVLQATQSESLIDLRFKPMTHWTAQISREPQNEKVLSNSDLLAQCDQPLRKHINDYESFWGNSYSRRAQILTEITRAEIFGGELKIAFNPFPKIDSQFKQQLKEYLRQEGLIELENYFSNPQKVTLTDLTVKFLDGSATKVFRKNTLESDLKTLLVGKSLSTQDTSVSIQINALDLWCDLAQRRLIIELEATVEEEDFRFEKKLLNAESLQSLEKYLNLQSQSMPELAALPEDQRGLLQGRLLARMVHQIPTLEFLPNSKPSLYALHQIIFTNESISNKMEVISSLFTQRWRQASKYTSTVYLSQLVLSQTNNQNQERVNNETNK